MEIDLIDRDGLFYSVIRHTHKIAYSKNLLKSMMGVTRRRHYEIDDIFLNVVGYILIYPVCTE